MRNIFLIILIFIFTLQKSPITNAQNEVLARLWNIPDDQIMNFLNRENFLKHADFIVKQQDQYLNADTYSGSYIRATDNNIVFYTIDETPVDIIIIKDLIYEVASERNPVLVAIFIDVELNNVVDLLDNEQPNSNASAINSRAITIPLLAGDGFCNIDEDITCSLGFFGMRQTAAGTMENVFVTSGRCYRYEMEYFLKPWGPLGIQHDISHHIGRMDEYRGYREYDYGILRITGEVEPVPSIKNLDSNYYPQIMTWNRNLIPNIHVGIHLCKSGYNTRVTCGYLRSNDAVFYDFTDP
ncbi:hypothetical protein C2G38_2251026 [Gigaspora rosea]|uniref:Peptidase S1 domain-containing protein n=1 Tax=Gigaspora rosea TaxID=44941 RepID=A0A397UIF0_9GLOM|nr:hypothetical protein C2G38_2251026 [Gigaspora rosea]